MGAIVAEGECSRRFFWMWAFIPAVESAALTVERDEEESCAEALGGGDGEGEEEKELVCAEIEVGTGPTEGSPVGKLPNARLTAVEEIEDNGVRVVVLPGVETVAARELIVDGVVMEVEEVPLAIEVGVGKGVEATEVGGGVEVSIGVLGLELGMLTVG